MYSWIFKPLSSAKCYDYLDLEFKISGLLWRWVLLVQAEPVTCVLPVDRSKHQQSNRNAPIHQVYILLFSHWEGLGDKYLEYNSQLWNYFYGVSPKLLIKGSVY